MTTCDELIAERAALLDLLTGVGADDSHDAPVLRSIARIDALLSLTDAQAAYLVRHAERGEADTQEEAIAFAHRVVAGLVKR